MGAHPLTSPYSHSRMNSDISIIPCDSNRLLISGWWRYSRKPNYAADWVQSLTWGLVVGTASPIPYFYSVFFITVLVHRCGRDFERYVIFFAFPDSLSRFY